MIAKDANFLDADNKDTDLNLRWAHLSEGTFSHVTVIEYETSVFHEKR